MARRKKVEIEGAPSTKGLPSSDEKVIPAVDERSEDASEQKPPEQLRFERFWTAIGPAGTDKQIKDSFAENADDSLSKFPSIASQYHVVALFEPQNSIDDGDLDQIFESLKRGNPERKKDVLLLLLSRGGSVEPAYQISKLCKQWSARRFVVAIPRSAKSAATLIALGADEIHIGPLGQLGPIDPQLGGLPALSVSRALQSIAQLAQEFPGSSQMFAAYLKQVLTVEQIGYCDRIAQSASQYATRLLSTKPSLRERAQSIARGLVEEYKDHSFVIDLDEARQLLGDDLVKSGTPELEFAEDLYDIFEHFNFFLNGRNKRLIIAGNWPKNTLLIDVKR